MTATILAATGLALGTKLLIKSRTKEISHESDGYPDDFPDTRILDEGQSTSVDSSSSENEKEDAAKVHENHLIPEPEIVMDSPQDIDETATTPTEDLNRCSEESVTSPDINENITLPNEQLNHTIEESVTAAGLVDLQKNTSSFFEELVVLQKNASILFEEFLVTDFQESDFTEPERKEEKTVNEPKEEFNDCRRDTVLPLDSGALNKEENIVFEDFAEPGRTSGSEDMDNNSSQSKERSDECSEKDIILEVSGLDSFDQNEIPDTACTTDSEAVLESENIHCAEDSEPLRPENVIPSGLKDIIYRLVESMDDCDSSEGLDDINERWESEVQNDIKPRSCGRRRVAFGKTTVHTLHDTAAHKQARNGPWVKFALKRIEFEQKISKLEPILSRVLDAGHRDTVLKNICDSNSVHPTNESKDVAFVSPTESQLQEETNFVNQAAPPTFDHSDSSEVPDEQGLDNLDNADSDGGLEFVPGNSINTGVKNDDKHQLDGKPVEPRRRGLDEINKQRAQAVGTDVKRRSGGNLTFGPAAEIDQPDEKPVESSCRDSKEINKQSETALKKGTKAGKRRRVKYRPLRFDDANENSSEDLKNSGEEKSVSDNFKESHNTGNEDEMDLDNSEESEFVGYGRDFKVAPRKKRTMDARIVIENVNTSDDCNAHGVQDTEDEQDASADTHGHVGFDGTTVHIMHDSDDHREAEKEMHLEQSTPSEESGDSEFTSPDTREEPFHTNAADLIVPPTSEESNSIKKKMEASVIHSEDDGQTEKCPLAKLSDEEQNSASGEEIRPEEENDDLKKRIRQIAEDKHQLVKANDLIDQRLKRIASEKEEFWRKMTFTFGEY
ncbi:uncharacterized protein [Macrobrachium rosenbergii]|uniref:uncharacterized protein n=1 Tax=Macrobrachium rosenbergii TaxID=79674 RepID=UPI0034D4362E